MLSSATAGKAKPVKANAVEIRERGRLKAMCFIYYGAAKPPCKALRSA
jgi:hypothetical protein